MQQKKIYASLQVFRGLAALMVVFHHLWNNGRHFYGLDIELLDRVAAAGKYGVDFFFVLSGFIITMSNYSTEKQAAGWAKYYLSRVIRVFIPYLPIGLLMYVLYQLLPGFSAGGAERNISAWTSFLLIPHGAPALSVAWTLVFEMFFYTIFSIWFISRKLTVGFFLLWAVACAYVSFYWGQLGSDSALANTALSHYNLEFILGLFTALFYMRYKKSSRFNFQKRGFLAVFILVAFALFFVGYSNLLFRTVLVGLLFSSLILLGLDSFLDRINKENVFMKIGNASYSIYLVHNVIISIGFRIFLFAIPFMPVVFSLFAIAVASCLGGLLYSRVFEIGLMRYVVKKI